MKLKKLLKIGYSFIVDASYRFGILYLCGYYSHMADKKYLKKKYRLFMGEKLNIEFPQTFNEKLQWLKLYDQNPIYTQMVDKVLAKKYVAERIGEEYIIPTIDTWSSADEIDFDVLPSKFVLKCNHNSGLGMYICKDKSKMDISRIKRNLRKGMKENYYLFHREWPYKDVVRKIFAEQYLEDFEVGGLTDYKIHCFNGIPKFILVCKDRFTESGLTEDFYKTDWEHMAIKRPQIPNATEEIPKPEKLEEMLSLAEKLSKGIPFVRVDFYYVDKKIYFSELTFFPASGFTPFEPKEWDRIFGEWLILPDKC